MARRRSVQTKVKPKKGPRPVDKRDSRIKAWNKPEDIPLDEEDEFQLSRDKILLEGEEEEDDDVGDEDEDEVFALKGLASSSSENDASDADEDDLDDNEVENVSSTMSASSKKKKKTAPTPSTSEEEEEEEEGWGRKKNAYYSSNAAQLDSDDEEANEMEEREARRLQAKLRDSMKEDDFGIGDAVLAATDAEQNGNNVLQLLDPPEKVVHVSQDKQSLIRHLEKASPETIALAQEWDDITRAVAKTGQKLKAMEASGTHTLGVLGMVHLYYHALLTYASVLAFYLFLRSSAKYATHPELLRFHPIMNRLLTLKQGLSTMEDLDFDTSEDEDEADELDEDDNLQDAYNIWGQDRKQGLDMELEALLQDSLPKLKIKVKVQGKDKPKQRKKGKENLSEPKAVVPVFDLEEPEYVPSKSESKNGPVTDDAFGEASSLDFADAADKNARRKTLRFHTAKIESISNRRQNARQAVGGDDDLPYRRRDKEQDKKIRASLGAGGDDLDDTDPDPASGSKKRQRVDESEDEQGSGDDYYDLVKKQKKETKDEKKAAYDAAKMASRGDIVEDVTAGQRSISRAILANKGLTPKRSKSVRNPRVKKRQRFEKAKRKVSSQKAVYKGGIGDVGRYDGERTGISKVIKSVKF